MTKKLVTIGVFTDLPTAHAAKSHLESEDIKCFLENESVHVANPIVFHEIKLQVEESEASKALKIIEGLKS